MKNKLIILALGSLLTYSCSDQLDRTPIDQLVEETAFQTVNDLEFGMNAFLGNYNPNTIIAHNSIFTDNTKIGLNNGGQEIAAFNQILNADTGDRGLWSSRYGLINDINRVIQASANVPVGGGEQSRYDNVLGQAYAFRALAHYDLLLYYGFDMTDATSAGVPYVDYVSSSALPARNTTGEVLAGIDADLTRASQFLSNVSPNISYATEDFVTFLRARIALETGSNNYQDAIDYATDIIGAYGLATTAEYIQMFNEDANTKEVVWRYDNVQGFNRNIAVTWIFTASGSSSESGFIEMSNELFNELLSANDVRLQVNLDPVSDVNINELLIGKYPPNSDTQYINDFKAMRVSEAYLIRAEAHARRMELGMAAADVFSVRDARSDVAVPAVSYTTQVQAMTDILAERRLELAFEGHRYNDIKRMRDVLNTGIDRDALDCPGAIPCTLPANSEKWIFPVPISEINANPNILPQAPGYGN